MDWKRKLASRKLWALIAALATSIILIFSTEETAAVIGGIILQLGAIVSYIYGESKVDAAYMSSQKPAEDISQKIEIKE